jgi:dihydroflavonol-4-reductase
MDVLVTGATGFIGSHVARALLADGHAVRGLRRPGAGRADLEGVRWVEGDLRSVEDLRAAMRGCDGLVHVAGRHALWGEPRAFFEDNVEGTRRALQAARAEAVERIVHTGSAATLVDEETPRPPGELPGAYERSKAAAEEVALRFAHEGMNVTIVSPAAALGPGDARTPAGRLVAEVLAGRSPRHVDAPMSFVDVRDVARGHALALRLGRRGRRYALGNRAGNVTLGALLRLVAEVAGLAPPRGGLPAWVAWLGGAASALWSDFGAEPPLSLDGVRLAAQRAVVDPRRAVEELGLPQTPLEATVRDQVAWLRAQEAARALAPSPQDLSADARRAAPAPPRR